MYFTHIFTYPSDRDGMDASFKMIIWGQKHAEAHHKKYEDKRIEEETKY